MKNNNEAIQKGIFKFSLILSAVLASMFSGNAQAHINKDTIISIPLDTKIDNKYNSYTTTIYKGNRSLFKGIPTQLNEKNSIIKYRVFDNVLDTIYFIIGDLNQKERVCIIDANKNHDLSDDFKYVYNKSTLTNQTDFPAQPINLTISKDGKKIQKIYFFKPDLINKHNISYNSDNEIQQNYFAMLGMSEYFVGKFMIKSKVYKIVIRPVISLNQASFEYAITDSVGYNFDSLKLKNLFIRFDQKIIYVGIAYQPLEVSENNSYINLRYSYIDNSSKAILKGCFEGLYLPRIIHNDINGEMFDSDKFKGSYILYDFWGTWCKPCIALLPCIAKIHQSYKDLKIVSIACEDTENDSCEVTRFIEKYQMNWINIIDKYSGKVVLSHTFNVTAYPTTILVNPQGEIIHRGTGEISLLNLKLEQIFKH